VERRLSTYSAHRALKRSVGFMVFMIALSSSQSILAQAIYNESRPIESPCDDLEAMASESFEPELIEHNDRSGMFFSIDASRFILCAVQELRGRRQELDLFERELSSLVLQVELTERQVELANTARERLNELVTHSMQRAREAEGRVDKWYRSPVLWFSVGVVVSIGLVVGGAYLISVN